MNTQCILFLFLLISHTYGIQFEQKLSNEKNVKVRALDYKNYEITALSLGQSNIEFIYKQNSRILHSLSLPINIEQVKSLDLPKNT